MIESDLSYLILKRYNVHNHSKCLIETILMITHKIFLNEEILMFTHEIQYFMEIKLLSQLCLQIWYISNANENLEFFQVFWEKKFCHSKYFY